MADRLTTSVRDSFLRAVHQWNFRGGAFKSLITKSTSAVQVFNIFITSEHISAEEKETFKQGRKLYVAFSKIRKPDFMTMLPLAEWSMEADDEIFVPDARSQGIYIPDLTFQAMSDDDTVQETTVINDDGSTTTTPGGIPSVPPGAPEDFVKQQEQNTKAFMEKVNGSNDRVFFGNYFDPKCVPDETEKTSTSEGVAEKQQDVKKETSKVPKKPATSSKNVPEPTKEKDEDMDEFAKSFKGLKGAFI